MVKLLIARGADPNLPNAEGLTPIGAAAHSCVHLPSADTINAARSGRSWSKSLRMHANPCAWLVAIPSWSRARPKPFPRTSRTWSKPSAQFPVRPSIATTLLDEVKTGKLNAMIARSADFYGPDARTSVPNILVFDKFAKRATASWLVNDSVPHSFTYTLDAAKSLVLLADSESAWNQTWHVPTAPVPPTGKEFIKMVAKEFGVEPKHRVLSRPLIRIAGWFDSDIRESYEMLYQSDSEYLFDSTRFSKAFGFEPTSYGEGIRRTASACKSLIG